MTDESQAIETMRRSLLAGGESKGPREDCPPADELWAAVAGELSFEGVEGLTDHLATCQLCSQLWEMARELRGASPGRDREPLPFGVPTSTPSKTPIWRRLAPLAAVLGALALGLAFFGIRNPDGPDGPWVRSGEAYELELSTPDKLPRERFLVEWRNAPPDSHHELLVVWSTSEAQRVVERVSGLKDSSYLLPASKLRDIPAGSTLRVTVWSHLGGEELGRKSTTIELQ